MPEKKKDILTLAKVTTTANLETLIQDTFQLSNRLDVR